MLAAQPGAWPALPHAVLAGCTHAEAADRAATGWPAPDLSLGARMRRRLDHMAGRLAASYAHEALTGRPAVVGRGADGAPIWPAGIVGAISHSGGRAVALVGNAAHQDGLGVDLETIETRPDEIVPLVLSAREQGLLGRDALVVTLAFSAKESLFKALYPRVRHLFGFDAAKISALADGEGWLRLRQPLGPWPQDAAFRFQWCETGGQVLTALSTGAISQARKVAPPST